MVHVQRWWYAGVVVYVHLVVHMQGVIYVQGWWFTCRGGDVHGWWFTCMGWWFTCSRWWFTCRGDGAREREPWSLEKKSFNQARKNSSETIPPHFDGWVLVSWLRVIDWWRCEYLKILSRSKLAKQDQRNLFCGNRLQVEVTSHKTWLLCHCWSSSKVKLF